MKFRKIKVRAFTLLECLLSLVVISASLLVFDGLSRNLAKEIRYQTTQKDKDWLVFAEQFRQELDESQLVRLENNRLYVKKANQELAYGKSKADDFRKTNWSGQGYQPMLQELKSADFSQKGQLIRLDLVFKNGMKRSFLHDMSAEG